MRPEPTRVWLVTEGDPATTEGTLSMDHAELRFVPATAGSSPLTIPLADIRRVRRGRGGPLLSLSFRRGEEDTKVFVYFARPPPLPGSRSVAPGPAFRSARGLETSAAALSLRAMSRLLRREIETWARALREARRA